ncbi:MAG: hypothetical protein K2X93_06910 [Candidatus Obscuribacterales bacterium]|nr:hypothetical protein [Candidatus Obscuribacterales bacterium]
MNKGIDTEYGGIMYRSRLEASWALFFDTNRIRHKYEPKRIDLGIYRYTPDFWLPEFGLLVEIKPKDSKNRQNKQKAELPEDKCYRTALQTKYPMLLIQGKPHDHLVDIFNPATSRRTFTHRTVVRECEIKPCKASQMLQADGSGKVIILTDSVTNVESLRFTKQQKPLSLDVEI